MNKGTSDKNETGFAFSVCRTRLIIPVNRSHLEKISSLALHLSQLLPHLYLLRGDLLSYLPISLQTAYGLSLAWKSPPHLLGPNIDASSFGKLFLTVLPTPNSLTRLT